MLHRLHLRILELVNVMVLMLILVWLCICLVNPGLFLDSPSADSSIVPAFPCEYLHHLLISSNSFYARNPPRYIYVFTFIHIHIMLSFLLTASTSHTLSPVLREIDIDSIQAPEPRSRDEFLQCKCVHTHTDPPGIMELWNPFYLFGSV